MQNLQTSKIFEELGLGRGNKKEKAKIIRLLTEVKLMSPNTCSQRGHFVELRDATSSVIFTRF